MDKQQSYRVLLVEDNSDTRLLVRKLLESYCQTRAVPDADEAVSRARERVYDVALIDINLGGGPDGLYVLETLRNLDEWEGVPLVALTAYAMPEDRERFLEAGFDAYLSKPFTKEGLIDTLEGVLSQKE